MSGKIPSDIAINCTLNVCCTVMGLEASDDALVHRLDVCGEIWFKDHNADILKVIRNDVVGCPVEERSCVPSLPIHDPIVETIPDRYRLSSRLCVVPVMETKLCTCVISERSWLLCFPNDKRWTLL